MLYIDGRDQYIGLDELLRKHMADDRPLTADGPVIQGIVQTLGHVQRSLDGQQSEIRETAKVLTNVQLALAGIAAEMQHISGATQSNIDLTQRMTRMEEAHKGVEKRFEEALNEAQMDRERLANWARTAFGTGIAALVALLGILSGWLHK